MYLFLKLIPPRPTFAADMTAEERDLMHQHAAYIRPYFDAGAVLAYGPVVAPEGAFGMAILDVPDLATAEKIVESDPSVLSRLNRYEIYPMHLGGAQGIRAEIPGGHPAVKP